MTDDGLEAGRTVPSWPASAFLLVLLCESWKNSLSRHFIARQCSLVRLSLQKSWLIFTFSAVLFFCTFFISSKSELSMIFALAPYQSMESLKKSCIFLSNFGVRPQSRESERDSECQKRGWNVGNKTQHTKTSLILDLIKNKRKRVNNYCGTKFALCVPSCAHVTTLNQY